MVWISALLVVLGLVFVARGVIMGRPGARSRPYRRFMKPPAWMRVPSGRRALGIAAAAIVALAIGTAAMDADRRPQRPAEADALVEEGSNRIPDAASQLMLPNAGDSGAIAADAPPATGPPQAAAAPQANQGPPGRLVLPQSDDGGGRQGRESVTNEAAESEEEKPEDKKKDEGKPEPTPQPDDGGGSDEQTNDEGEDDE